MMAEMLAPAPRPQIHSRRPVIGGRYNKRNGMPRLIQDVGPAVRERVAIVEHDLKNMQREFNDHKQESIRASADRASKEAMVLLEKDLTKEITAINKRLDKRVALVVLQTFGLVASTLYAVILSYKHFIQP